MTAILINTINDSRVVVHSTTEHPSSSYGMPVWVDKDNEAYMQVGASTPFYKVVPVDTIATNANNGNVRAIEACEAHPELFEAISK